MTAVFVLTALLTGSLRAGETPVAGGLQSLPLERNEKVSLTNGSFEDGLEGWKGGPTFSVVPDEAHAGKKCLKWDAAAKGRRTPSISQVMPHLGPGLYTLRYWIKTQLPAGGRAGGLRVTINHNLEGGGRRWPSAGVLNGTADWRLIEHRFLLPKNLKKRSTRITISRYRGVEKGVAFLDGFTLERSVPPAVEAYLLYPNYRGYLPADGPQRLRVWVKVNESGAKEPARLEVTSLIDRKKVAAAELPAGTKEKIVELDASKWPLGRYALKTRLGKYEYATYIISKISPQQRDAFGAWFDEHNVLHMGGKAVFPIGFYNTTRKFGIIDDGEIARLDKMAEAPTNFNINYTWWNCSLADRKRYMGEMNKRGIWYLDTLMPYARNRPVRLKADENYGILKDLMPGLKSLETQEQKDRFLTLLGKEMRKLPGHAGWYVMDERPFGMVPSVFHLCDIMRRADPDHPTYGVNNKPGQVHFWRDTLDVFGLDPYPFLNMARGRPLTIAGNETRVCVDATHGSRPVWMVLHYFRGWSKDRWPTTEELRTMSLMAITEGARGIFYWSFGQKGILSVRNAKLREEYWQRGVTVTKELKSIEPALVAPDALDIVSSVSDPRIRWRARAAGGKWYVFAYLPAKKFAERAATEPVEVIFTLKDGRKVSKKFRPDTADWFEATPQKQ